MHECASMHVLQSLENLEHTSRDRVPVLEALRNNSIKVSASDLEASAHQESLCNFADAPHLRCSRFRPYKAQIFCA